MLATSLHVLQQGGPKFKPVGRHKATTLFVQRPGAFYGRGAYFSDNAAYSDEHFAFTVPSTSAIEGGPHRQLILARVLCGRTYDYGVRIDTKLVRPPAGFDSVRGGPHSVTSKSVHSCRMTVVYDRTQVYPQYIVTYRKVPRPVNTYVASGAGAGAGAGTGAGAGAGADTGSIQSESAASGQSHTHATPHQRGTTKRSRQHSGRKPWAASRSSYSPARPAKRQRRSNGSRSASARRRSHRPNGKQEDEAS